MESKRRDQSCQSFDLIFVNGRLKRRRTTEKVTPLLSAQATVFVKVQMVHIQPSINVINHTASVLANWLAWGFPPVSRLLGV